MGILSDLLRKASKKYEKTTGRLYRKSNDPEKKCGVCYLGAIALIGAPQRFVVDETLTEGVKDLKTGRVHHTRTSFRRSE